jgi:hypothetical protein
MIPLVARAGLRWMATDEGILGRTLGRSFTRDGSGNIEQPEVLYRPYTVGPGGEASVACGFRDHTLSDLIGFTYGSWGADAAADDFVRRLVEAGARHKARSGGGDATIFVILDGENAWEHYEGQGRPFLRALYGRLSNTPELRTVTMAEACADPTDRLPSIFPGSWINSDFYIWIGHADDHRAWGQLAEARRALDTSRPGLPEAALARAREEMLIAEGSDWFWWYGDDHSSEHDMEFDELFRVHLRNIYRALEKPIPEELFVSNITTEPPATVLEPPTAFIHPVIDGEVTDYFEWVGAGCADSVTAAGAMHQVAEAAAGIGLVEFGFDLEHLYLRIDGTRPMAELLAGGVSLTVRFLKPVGFRVVAQFQRGTLEALLERRHDGGDWKPAGKSGIVAAAGRVLEMEIPFAALQVKTADPVAFFVVLTREIAELQQHPRQTPIELEVPDRRFPSRNWTA